MLFREVDEAVADVVEPTMPAPPAPAAHAIDEAVALLRKARRPIIIAGGGVFAAGAWEPLRELAAHLQAPVVANTRGRGCLPEHDRLSGGPIATMARLQRLGEEGTADVVLVLGARLGLFTGGVSDVFIPARARIIQVDIAAEEIGRNRAISVGIAADCGETLRALLQRLRRVRTMPDRAAWVKTVRQTRLSATARFDEIVAAHEGPIHPYRVIADVQKAAPRNTLYVADGGEAAEWAHLGMEVREPGGYLSHGYLGSLGIGLPFALGCKVAEPRRPVICFTGDGAVGFNLQEFHTAVRHNLPVVLVILNDQIWGMSRHAQTFLYGEGSHIATDLGPVAYDRVAEAFGGYGESVERAEEIGPAVKRALASGRFACLNIQTDPAVVHAATRAASGALQPPDETNKAATALPYYGRRVLR